VPILSEFPLPLTLNFEKNFFVQKEIFISFEGIQRELGYSQSSEI